MSWIGYLWKKGKVEEWKEEKNQLRGKQAAAVEEIEIGKGKAVWQRGAKGVVVMSIAKQSGVTGCSGRTAALRFVVTMSTLSASAHKTLPR